MNFFAGFLTSFTYEARARLYVAEKDDEPHFLDAHFGPCKPPLVSHNLEPSRKIRPPKRRAKKEYFRRAPFFRAFGLHSCPHVGLFLSAPRYVKLHVTLWLVLRQFGFPVIVPQTCSCTGRVFMKIEPEKAQGPGGFEKEPSPQTSSLFSDCALRRRGEIRARLHRQG